MNFEKISKILKFLIGTLYLLSLFEIIPFNIGSIMVIILVIISMIVNITIILKKRNHQYIFEIFPPIIFFILVILSVKHFN